MAGRHRGRTRFAPRQGMQATSNGTADAPQFSTIAGANFLTFGQDPNDLTNATGRLPNDRPHIFRTTGVVHAARGTACCWPPTCSPSAANPGPRRLRSSCHRDNQRILLETRGSRRCRRRRCSIAGLEDTAHRGAATVDLNFDVLNALNDTAERGAGLRQPVSAATFGAPSRSWIPGGQ